MTKSLVAAAALAVLAASSFAQTAPARSASTPVLDKRETMQQKRVDKAESSGALTTQEQNNVDKREQHISNMETQAKSDGTVTGQERRQIRHSENRTNRAIRRKAHNGRASDASGS
jgi:Spy/CpxP family protein refolding chaperone